MRDCYKKFWKTVLAEKIDANLPMFKLKEAPSKKAADEVKASAKPVQFVWNPAGQLRLFIRFRALGRQDEFEAWCGWSEVGARRSSGGEFLWDNPFDREQVGQVVAQDVAGDPPCAR